MAVPTAKAGSARWCPRSAGRAGHRDRGQHRARAGHVDRAQGQPEHEAAVAPADRRCGIRENGRSSR